MFKHLNLNSSSPLPGLRWRSHSAFILFTVGTGCFTDLFLYGLIVPVVPFMLRDRVRIPDSEIQSSTSSLLAIYAGASCVTAPITGILADKFALSRKLPFVLGLIMLAFATVLLAIGQTYFFLATARLLQGISAGIVWTIGLTIIVETVSKKNLGKAMGTLFSFVSISSLISPTLGGLLYEKTGYNGVFGVGIALVVIDFGLRVLMVEKGVAAQYGASSQGTNGDIVRQEELGENDTEETPLLLNRSSPPDRYCLAKPQNRLTQAVPIILMFTDIGLLVATAIAFMQAFLLGAFDATIPLQASEQFGFNSLKAGLLFLPLAGTDFLLGSIYGWGVDRYGTRLFSVLGFAGLVPSLILLRLPSEQVIMEKLGHGPLTALYASLLALNGIFLSPVGSVAVVECSAIVEKYSKANKHIFEQTPLAQLYGINSLVFSLGLTLGPLVTGALRNKIGYGNMNIVLASICALMAILSALFIDGKDDDLKTDEHDG